MIYLIILFNHSDDMIWSFVCAITTSHLLRKNQDSALYPWPCFSLPTHNLNIHPYHHFLNFLYFIITLHLNHHHCQEAGRHTELNLYIWNYLTANILESQPPVIFGKKQGPLSFINCSLFHNFTITPRQITLKLLSVR